MRWFLKTLGVLALIILFLIVLTALGVNAGKLLAISIAVAGATILIGASVYLGFIFYFIKKIFTRFRHK